MKIALCQMAVVAKRPDLNVPKMVAMMREAAAKGSKVVCFSELCIPGYMVGDLWEDSSFINDCIAWEEDVTKAADELGVTVIYGTVRNGEEGVNYEDGRQIRFNSVKSYNKAELINLAYDKINRPNYREFEDKRYFAQGEYCPHPCSIGLGQDSFYLSTTVCEDGWDDDYADKPVKDAFEQLGEDPEDPHLHFNLSCSPYTKGKNGARNRRFSKHSEMFAGLFYVNCVGIQDNGKDVFVFDGSTTVYDKGVVRGALPALKECIGYVTVLCDSSITLGEGPWLMEQKDPTLSEVLVYGTKSFLEASGLKKAVIGLSGGMDSALSAMIHVQALGAENVILVNMPTEFNSATTKGIAASIAKKLGCPYMVVPIGLLCGGIESVIGSSLKDVFLDAGGMGFVKYDETNPLTPIAKEYKVDPENIAARMRGSGIQAALAAGLKAVFPNNGNKSEVSVGYCTMYGDHAGYLAPIADLWKTEVYEVAREMSDSMGGILPEEIFTLKPSAELSADHNVDLGKGDPLEYWYHDKLLASWVEPWQRKGIEGTAAIVNEGGLPALAKAFGLPVDRVEALFPTMDRFFADTERWWKQLNGIAVVKRVQSPPILVVSRRAYGFDFREAIGYQGLTKEYMSIKETLLG